MVEEKIIRTVKHVACLLVEGDYFGLERLSKGIRLSADEIAKAIKDYRATPTMPPEIVFDNVDVVEVGGYIPRRWDVRLNIWTAEEGRSDLTLEMTLIDSDKEIYDIEIDNIHVL
jgi:hypothetical protein